jgi:hypothetical protein
MKRFQLFLCIFPVLGISSQTANAAQPACSLVPPPLSVARANIFNAEQEQWLGDAQSDLVEPRYTILPDSESAYITQIGQKLLAQLPSTPIHYSFHLFESADLRSFSLSGGHVYISRKLVLDARSEDELAAMLAQEIGRAYTHHAASLVTLRLNKMMNVKSLGDRSDVVDRFQRLLNIPIPDNAQLNDEEQKKDELLADRVALYALIKAGFAPQAFTSFLDRINLNGGYTGNFFTDLFETTPDVSVRIRQAHKVIESLPDSCRIIRPQYRPQFKPFQEAMSAERINPFVSPTPDLRSIAVDPPMNPALENVRLSPDGKYALAQNDAQIHVLTTTPTKLLFSIDAPGAQMAQFTPDSANVVFYYDTLRVENWNVLSQQPAGVLDFPDYIGCQQTSLSPVGNAFACFTRNGDSVWLRLIDLQSGQVLYQNLNIFRGGFGDWNSAANLINGQRQAAATWSQDGRYFLAVSGSGVVCFDMQQRREVKLKGPLSNLYEGRFAFVDSNKLLFECDWGSKNPDAWNRFKMCFTTFPDGQSIKNLTLGLQWLAPITKGPRVLTGPVEGAAAAFLDPATGTSGPSFKLETVDLSGDTMAEEAPNGDLLAGKAGGTMSSVTLPVSPLPPLEAGAFSADGRYLAISDRGRGATWDLSTGKRIAATSPFRTASFDGNGKLLTRFVNQELKPAGDTAVDWKTQKVIEGVSVGITEARYGNLLLRMKTPVPNLNFYISTELEGDDATTGARLWSRHFSYGIPEIAPADGDHILLTMDPKSDIGGDQIRHNRNKFIRTADEVGKYDKDSYLIEVVSSQTGAIQRLVLAPELKSSQGLGRSAGLFGDLLAVHGGRNNTVIYRLTDGTRLMAFFGRALACDPGLGLVAANNRTQELSIYDIRSGRELERLTMDRAPLLARFIPDKRQLLVLTATQQVYILNLPENPPVQTSGEK